MSDQKFEAGCITIVILAFIMCFMHSCDKFAEFMKYDAAQTYERKHGR